MFLRLMLVLFSASLSLAVPAALSADEALWIDVRTSQEFDDGHVSQALNIPYQEIAGQIESVTTDKDALIYVYCRSGRRSGIAKETLEGMGYTQVVNAGGLEEALKRAGEPSID